MAGHCYKYKKIFYEFNFKVYIYIYHGKTGSKIPVLENSV